MQELFNPQIIGSLALLLAALVLALIAGALVFGMYTGTAQNLMSRFLFEEIPGVPEGKPSVSRLQMVIWNFVVAFAFLYTLGSQGPEKVVALFKPEILVLLGISNLTYFLGKRTTPGIAKPPAGGQPPPAAPPSGGQPAQP